MADCDFLHISGKDCKIPATVGVGYTMDCGQVDVWYHSCDIHGFHFAELMLAAAPRKITEMVDLELDQERIGHG